MTAAERVARGVAWLDATVEGWRDKIPVDKLRMVSGCRCVAGWVFSGGSYEVDGFEWLWALTEDVFESTDDADLWLHDHGFIALDDRYGELQAEWERVLR